MSLRNPEIDRLCRQIAELEDTLRHLTDEQLCGCRDEILRLELELGDLVLRERGISLQHATNLGSNGFDAPPRT